MLLVLVAICAFSVADGEAQSPTAEVQTAYGVHAAVFRTPQGDVTVHVSSDAAAGDTLSGVVLAEPAGSTPEERSSNLGQLNGFVIGLQGQPSTPVSARRYEWKLPPVIAGTTALVLRDAAGRATLQTAVPVDPVRPTRPTLQGRNDFELPTEGRPDRPVIVRGAFDGTFRDAELRVGSERAELVAASPRRVIFRVPETAAGPVPLRFAYGGAASDGRMRVTAVRLSATNTQLLRGQRATLTVTAVGPQGITEPVTLSIRNVTAAIVQLQGGVNQTMTIRPTDVSNDGTFTLTRTLTGIQPGGFSVSASVTRPQLSQFNVPRAIDRFLDSWTANTGVRIDAAARQLIQRSVTDARARLDDFLRGQQANQADVREVFELLLSHYCFDLRDDVIQRSRGRAAGPALAVVFASFRQGPARDLAIGPDAVRRFSFSSFLSQLIARLSAPQPVGYLVISSVPDHAAISIDGQQKNAVTNRRFVTSVGSHQVLVGNRCREQVTVAAFQTTVIACSL
jgi:hypothetical protein